ncbi:MAG: hypothetical protein V2A58_04230, partial [Planctomycetota bacterium]
MSDPRSSVLADFHPEYLAALPQWAFYRDAYEGDPDVMPRYLMRHEREADDIHRQRRARAYYLNFTAAVVDLYAAYLFRTPPMIEPPSDAREDYEAFLRDADRGGSTLRSLLSDAARWAAVYGHVGLLVDVPSDDGAPLTSESARRACEVRPYLVVVPPTSIVDWSLDSRNVLRWVRILEENQDLRSPFEARPSGSPLLYRTFTRDEWFLDATEKDRAWRVAQGRHDLGRVPLVLCYNARRRPSGLLGVSAVRDIARINLAIYNWCSLLDEEVYNKCLNILLVPAVGVGSDIVIGSRNVLEYDPSLGERPSYLTPPSHPMQSILDLIQRAGAWIYRLAKLGGVRKLQETGEIGSGVALKQEFLETNQALREKADYLERAARQVMDLVSLYLGRERFAGVVDFPEEFGVRDFLAELSLVASIGSAVRSATARRAAEKEFCAAFFP